jgi:hypothetical protein
VIAIGRWTVVLSAAGFFGGLGVAAGTPQRTSPPPAKHTRHSVELRRPDAQVLAIAEDLTAGRPVPNDFALTWIRDDLFKDQDNKQYVPFTIALETSKLTAVTDLADQGAEPLDVYFRVVARAAAPRMTEGAEIKRAGRPQFSYEDMTPTSVGPGPMARITRSFSVPAGTYDVYVVVREAMAAQRGAPPRAAALRRAIVVPDLWNGELSVSSVILAERIDPLAAPLTPQQKLSRPYALDSVEIVPLARTRFSRREELSAFLQIYNAQTDSDRKPDVSVQFNFYLKQATGEKFFNNTLPTNLNARTLPKEFSLGSGRQLQTGQAVQLATFPEGEYRLEIRVTDNLAKKTLARELSFTVSAS